MLGDEGTQRQIREHDGIEAMAGRLAVGIVSEEVAALLSHAAGDASGCPGLCLPKQGSSRADNQSSAARAAMSNSRGIRRPGWPGLTDRLAWPWTWARRDGPSSRADEWTWCAPTSHLRVWTAQLHLPTATPTPLVARQHQVPGHRLDRPFRSVAPQGRVPACIPCGNPYIASLFRQLFLLPDRYPVAPSSNPNPPDIDRDKTSKKP
jgi:hypothetical protein